MPSKSRRQFIASLGALSAAPAVLAAKAAPALPQGSRNLMVAGRCLSSDRLANSALRVQAPCMAMGQAAGVTAMLAARQSTTPSKVSLAEIHRTLVEHGAIVPAK